MALNFSEMTPARTDMNKRSGAGRAPAVPDSENPFIASGWLKDTYGENVQGMSLKVPASEAKGVQYLANRAAEKLDLGVSIEFRTLSGELVVWESSVQFEGENEPRGAWVHKDSIKSDTGLRVATNKMLVIAWKAKDRKRNNPKES